MRLRKSSAPGLKKQLDFCKALVLNIELAKEIEQNYLLLEQTDRTILKKAREIYRFRLSDKFKVNFLQKSILRSATKSIDKSAFCKTCPEVFIFIILTRSKSEYLFSASKNTSITVAVLQRAMRMTVATVLSRSTCSKKVKHSFD